MDSKSGWSLRKHYNRQDGDETPVTVDGTVYDRVDTYEIGEIGIRDGAVIEVIYQLIDDKYAHLLLVAADDLPFGDMSRGFTITRYVSKEYALALRSAWHLVRPQPDLRNAEQYFKKIRVAKSGR